MSDVINTGIVRRGEIEGVISRWHRLYLHHKPLLKDICDFAESVEGGSLLDVGCGNKPYKKLFDVSEYVGIDPDESNKSADCFGSVYELPFEDEKFEYAVSFQVLEHLNEPVEALKEINRVMKKGGQLFITVPQSWETHEIPYDFFRYTEFGLQHILTKAGFKIIYIKKQGCFVTNTVLRLNRVFNRKIIRVIIPLLNYFGEKFEKNNGNDVVNYGVLAEKI